MMERGDNRFNESLKAVIATPEGRCVLETILNVCGIEVSVYSKDSSVRDYHLGRQAIGMQLAQAIRELESKAWPNFLIDCEDDHERYDGNRESDQ